MILETHGLRKSFTRRGVRGGAAVTAVDGVDLGVKETEIFGFLGPNGAGKTTTMRMLTTLLRPDGGEATVVGHDLLHHPDRVRRDIGFVQQTGGLWDTSTPREELVLQGRMQGLGARAARSRADEVMALLQIDQYATRPCIALSGGERRRVEIGLGIVHSPALVFLDEPSTGLDPNSRSALWHTIRDLRDQGVTIFLTTHYLDEADALCDRISIVDHGQVVATGSPTELKREIAGDVVTVDIAGGAPAELARLDGVVELLDAPPGQVRLVVDDGERTLAPILALLAAHGVGISAVELHRASLDDVFRARTGRGLAG